MFFTYITARNGLTRMLAGRLLAGGVLLIALGLFVLVFPMIVASIVAAMCFIVSAILLGGAWRIYRASPPLHPTRTSNDHYEEAAWREIH